MPGGHISLVEIENIFCIAVKGRSAMVKQKIRFFLFHSFLSIFTAECKLNLLWYGFTILSSCFIT